MKTTSFAGALALGASVATLLAAVPALAADAAAAAGTPAGSGAEATDITNIVVTAEHNIAAATAPTKASLTEQQPESIITHRFIEDVRPESGDYTTTVLIAPSMAGTSSNGGGVGETNKSTLRGFQDGMYNLTYDGIAFGDTNDPTHHPASYFPASTIGAAVIDRGPGSAGDLGQANFGGAIHLFSPTVSNAFGTSQKFTYGTFDTMMSVSQLQTGAVDALHGGKLLLVFQELRSDGELSNSDGVAQNQTLKYVQPINDKTTLTLFASHNYTRYFQSDAGPGETWRQVQTYGKNFALTNDPTDEHYKGFNHEKKQTDFEYIDLKGDVGYGVTYEDQAYTYFYSNKTISVNDITGLIGQNTSPPKSSKLPATDIGGYDKGNRYRVYGDIVRINKDWSFGTLKAGALWEGSSTDRHNLYIDLTQGGIADNKFKTGVLNAKTLEYSSWDQYQVFADFEWRPLENLTIQPGVKYVNFTRNIDGIEENSGTPNFPKHTSAIGSNTYDKPLYFATVNYRILPYWSVYGQYATGFLIPSLSFLQATNPSLNSLQPEETTNYQLGTVFTRGHVTADADVYQIHVTNLQVADPTGQFYENAGTADYSGVEGQAAYAFDFGLTLFANGSLNTAKNATAHNTELNAPKWTDAVGALYNKGPWSAAVTYKQTGAQVVAYSPNAQELPAYDTTDASVAYDFGHFKVKLAGFNLFDNRAVINFSGATLYSAADAGLYQFQAGRQIQVTLEAKF
ncbi:TonB-dependent receptor [Phenylobacterium montanum]|uniref:TonB-dependent receptor n=1 Tax=Phenylobacterium montanum TaxID=2823693 RepID=A0A975FZ01_9CAUL|nr:TonB-dependent receptor [Caulobacter sp. S6]QUD88025.1 TonB-dependent receptor [Caulobacter sp. S6]